MGKKYLDTKEGSLEQSVLGVWQTAIDESDARVDGRTKNYKEHRAKLEAARQRREEKKLNKEEVDLDEKNFKKGQVAAFDKNGKLVGNYADMKTAKKLKPEKDGHTYEVVEEVELDEGSKEEYQKFFNAAMKKFKIDSPADLKSDEDKKKFFDYVDKNYKGEKDEEFQKLHQQLFPEADVKEEVELDEKAAKYLEIEFKDKTTAEKAYNHINNKIEPGGNQPWDDFNQEGNSIQFDNMEDADGLMKELKKKFKFKVYEREEVQVKEGKMSQLHQLIKDKKSAEEISKIMRLDLKSVKALMSGYGESYEIGTDEYRKHTEDVTPGEDGEWVNAVKKKNESMREALARVWEVTEDKNPFKKEDKKDLTKEVKDGKTMTGKKIAKVDVEPKIMEKKK